MTRRRLWWLAGATLVLAAATISWRVSRLPVMDAAEQAAVRADTGSVRVAYHVHTSRSDGTGTAEVVAAAAAAAGLDAVILTDHGDATRAPEPPQRIAGVLLIDAVEISTWAGHYVALGLPPAPYPLGGEPAAVVEDVARLGGVGIVAHPASAKDDLKWRDWDAPFDGVEWMNADSEWRDRPRRLWDAVLTYPFAAPATLAALLDRPVRELHEWDRRIARTPAIGLAAHDAHARLGLRGLGEPYDDGVALRVPGYAAMFRAFTNVVDVAPAAWGRDAALDAAAVLAAIRAGRTYAVITGRGAGRVVTFKATSGNGSAGMGGHLAADGAVEFVAETTAPPSAETTLVCDGAAVATARGPRLTWTSPRPAGACRLEVALAGAVGAAPWIVTNPIYVRPLLSRPAVLALPAARATVPITGSGRPDAWTAEVAPGATAEVDAVDGVASRLAFTWALGAGTGPFAALRLDPPADLATFDRLILRARSDRPLRVWLQLRTPADGGHRWGSSVYLDATTREITVPFDRMLSLDRRASVRVPLDRVTALLLVVDTVYARPGGHGTVTFDELWMAR